MRGATAPDGRRVRLLAVRAGARWLTTESALQLFLESLTPILPDDAASEPVTAQAKLQRHAARQDAQKRAQQELDKLGI